MLLGLVCLLSLCSAFAQENAKNEELLNSTLASVQSTYGVKCEESKLSKSQINGNFCVLTDDFCRAQVTFICVDAEGSKKMKISASFSVPTGKQAALKSVDIKILN